MENDVSQTGVGCGPVVTGVSTAKVFAAVPSAVWGETLRIAVLLSSSNPAGPWSYVTAPAHAWSITFTLTMYRRLSYVTISASAGAVFITYLPCGQYNPLCSRNCLVVAGSSHPGD